MTRLNAFSASKSYRLEDQVTRAFVLVLGQSIAARRAVLDLLLPSDWDRRVEEWEAIDHPFKGEVNQPDMLLKSARQSVACEHNLMSRLGRDQLERYLFMTGEPYVLLISHARVHPSSEILAHPKYLHPEGSHYFTWAQIYSALVGVSEPLVVELLRWLDELGFAPVRGADGKPWLDSSGREPSLYDHLEPLAYLLKEEGRVPRRAPGGHGLEVIPSLHWARFFRFHALSRDPRRLGQSATPRFAAWLYLAEEHARQGPWRESSHTIRGSSPRIKSKPLQIKRPCTTSVVVREWSTSLGPILADQSGVRAIRFADRVIADSKGYDLRLPASLNALREASGARSSTHSVRRQRRPARNASRRASWLGG